MTPLNIFALIFLFTLLSPNVLFRLPGNKYVSALLHGVLFSLAWYIHPVLEGLDAKGMRCENLRKKLAVKNIKENEKKKIENQLKQDKC